MEQRSLRVGIFILGLQRGLLLEGDARRLIADHARTRENLSTASRIIERLKGGEREEVEQAIQQLERREAPVKTEVEEVEKDEQ